ncbi:hypothetical protein OSTOST_18948, partial [Ostertagia ostertagi]
MARRLFADTLCLTDNSPDGTYETSTLASLYNTALIAVQYLLPLLVLSCAYYRVGVVLRKDKSVGDSIHAKSVAAKKKYSDHEYGTDFKDSDQGYISY